MDRSVTSGTCWMLLKACFHFFPSLARSHCLCFIFRAGLKVISHKQDQYMEHIRDFSERSGDFQPTDQRSQRGLEHFFPFFHWQSLSIAVRGSRGKADLTVGDSKTPRNTCDICQQARRQPAHGAHLSAARTCI